MTYSRRQTFRIGAGAALSGVAMPWASRAQSTLKLDLSTVWPDGNFHTQNCKRFAEEIGKTTGGAVHVTVHSGGSLGYKGPEHLNAVRDGLVPMADVLNIQQVGEVPLMGLEAIAFLVPGPEQLRILHKYLRPEYEKIAAKYNQKILYMVPWPNQYLHCKVKTDTLEGFKGLKIRVPDRNAQEMVQALGMVGVLIPWGETVPALASGAVVGVTTSATSGVDGKFWEFLKYFYATNHAWSCQMVTINLDTWKKIGANHQAAIAELGAKLEPDFWQVSIGNDASSSKRLTDGGMERITPSPAMLKEMQAKTAFLVDAFVKRVGGPSGDIIAKYKKDAGLA
jgi:TRAP-type C4-dicarboxylate transport system substrate-binding protein